MLSLNISIWSANLFFKKCFNKLKLNINRDMDLSKNDKKPKYVQIPFEHLASYQKWLSGEASPAPAQTKVPPTSGVSPTALGQNQVTGVKENTKQSPLAKTSTCSEEIISSSHLIWDEDSLCN